MGVRAGPGVDRMLNEIVGFGAGVTCRFAFSEERRASFSHKTLEGRAVSRRVVSAMTADKK